MNKKNILQEQKAITLIALIITIVVMLILAGVTINLTLGQNGIFTTAQKVSQNYTDAQNKELLQLSDFTDGLTAGKVTRTQDGIQYVGDGVGNLIPVPVGFSYLEGTKGTGFVIKNNTDKNEFVWVPVGSIANYKRVGWIRNGWTYNQILNESTGEITREDLGNSVVWTEIMPTDERDSITTYGGFYIGRYEAGIKDYESKNETRQEPLTTEWTAYEGDNTTLVIQDKQEVWNYITRDKAIKVAEDLYNKSTNNVKSKLCSSYAWDSALKFIETNNQTYPTNSIGGNYKVDSDSARKLQPTGYHAVNNIYDMGGNSAEWTTESLSNANCVYRGGGFNNIVSDIPASIRGSKSQTYAYNDISFRITLFM